MGLTNGPNASPQTISYHGLQVTGDTGSALGIRRSRVGVSAETRAEDAVALPVERHTAAGQSAEAQESSVSELTDDAGLEILNEEECLQLMEQSNLGRVALCLGAAPAIFPVNYFVLDGRILFRTRDGTKLRAAANRTMVAFEVDDADDEFKTGWSVLAVGPATEVHEPSVVDFVMRQPVPPRAPGVRDRVIAVHPEFLSGRRIPSGTKHK